MLEVTATVGGFSEKSDIREKLKSMYAPYPAFVENYVHSTKSDGWFILDQDLTKEKQINLTFMRDEQPVYHGPVWIVSYCPVDTGIEYHFEGPTQFFPPKMYGED